MAVREEVVRLLVQSAFAGMEKACTETTASANEVVSAGATLTAMLFDAALKAGTAPAVLQTAAQTILLVTTPTDRVN